MVHNHLNEMCARHVHALADTATPSAAIKLHDALSVSGTPLRALLSAAGPPSFDPKQIESIMAARDLPEWARVPDRSPTRRDDHRGRGGAAPSDGGRCHSLQDLGDGKAASPATSLIASEVNPVARTLRANGIEVTALHNHALGDEPRLFYMHFWAHDDALKLARGRRAALDLTNSRK